AAPRAGDRRRARAALGAERLDGEPHRAVLLCGVTRGLEQADEMIVELTGLGIDVAVDLPGEAALGEARAVFADRRAINRCGRRGRRGQQRRRWCGRRGPSGRGDGHRLGPWRLAARLGLDLYAHRLPLALRAPLPPARLRAPPVAGAPR